MFQHFSILRFFYHNASTPLYILSSLVDGKSFTEMVRKGGFMLEKIIENDIVRENKNIVSRAFLDEVRNRSKTMCLGLTTLRQEDVEEIIHEEYKLKDERLMTCLVPYQCAVNIILSRLPDGVKQEYLKEIKRIEGNLDNSNFPHDCSPYDNGNYVNKWVSWRDDDVYISTGKEYIQRIKGKQPFTFRVPVFAVVGHTQHGKTALLDAFLGTNIGNMEPHRKTQTCRTFTTKSSERKNQLTFIDTPGDKMFVEARYFCHLISDFIVLVISVVEGLESQTYEAIKVALNVDRPIIVVFTKMDVLTDEIAVKRRLSSLLRRLSDEGLNVTLLPFKKKRKKKSGDPFEASIALWKEKNLLDCFFLPMHKIDPDYRGSIYQPILSLKRQCIGLCISVKNNDGVDDLRKLFNLCREINPCYCLHENIHWKTHNAVVQAAVIDSSKHLFNEEEFRVNPTRQKMQRYLDKRIERGRKGSGGIINNMYRLLGTANGKSTSQTNRTSTSSLVVNAIVQEGLIAPGMHFIADQSEGCVDAIFTYSGERLKEATPGMAVTLVDLRSRSGCPGSGGHVLSVRDEVTRFKIHRYRQMLQWYIEAFPTQLHLLRPKGADTKFSHVGNFGQIGLKRDSLEAQLLYGKQPQGFLEENVQLESLEAFDSNRCNRDVEQLQASKKSEDNEALSVGEYIARKNQENSEKSLLTLANTSKHCCICPSRRLDSNTQKLSRASEQFLETPERLFPSSVEALLESSWRSYQPEKPCATSEEYNLFLKGCIHVGVLLKVDSWHTARMLSRELLRWGTNLVMFQVVGIRFGPLDEEDILFFGQAAKIILCFRTPLSNSINLDSYLETQDTWVLQTDHIRDVELFAKWCSVTLHRQEKERKRDR